MSLVEHEARGEQSVRAGGGKKAGTGQQTNLMEKLWPTIPPFSCSSCCTAFCSLLCVLHIAWDARGTVGCCGESMMWL